MDFSLHWVVVCCFVACAQCASYQWVGGLGAWSNASNWSPPGIPGPADSALIPATGTVTISSVVTVASLEIQAAEVELLATSLTVSSTFSAQGTLSGGSLFLQSGSNSSTLGALFLVNVTCSQSGSLALQTGFISLQSSTIINHAGATFTIGAISYVSLDTNSTFRNDGTLVFTVEGSLESQSSDGADAFINNGVVMIDGATGAGASLGAHFFINNGIITSGPAVCSSVLVFPPILTRCQLGAGLFLTASNFTNTGTINATVPVTLQCLDFGNCSLGTPISGTSWTLSALNGVIDVTNPLSVSTLVLTDGPVNLQTSLSVPSLTIDGAIVSLPAGGSITVSGSFSAVLGSATTSTISGGSLVLPPGSISSILAPLNLVNSTCWQGGSLVIAQVGYISMQNSTIQNRAGASVTLGLQVGVLLDQSSSFTNDGLLVFAALAYYGSQGYLQPQSWSETSSSTQDTLVNNGIVLLDSAAGAGPATLGAHVFINNGIITSAAALGAGLVLMATNFTNTGTINATVPVQMQCLGGYIDPITFVQAVGDCRLGAPVTGTSWTLSASGGAIEISHDLDVQSLILAVGTVNLGTKLAPFSLTIQDGTINMSPGASVTISGNASISTATVAGGTVLVAPGSQIQASWVGSWMSFENSAVYVSAGVVIAPTMSINGGSLVFNVPLGPQPVFSGSVAVNGAQFALQALPNASTNYPAFDGGLSLGVGCVLSFTWLGFTPLVGDAFIVLEAPSLDISGSFSNVTSTAPVFMMQSVSSASPAYLSVQVSAASTAASSTTRAAATMHVLVPLSLSLLVPMGFGLRLCLDTRPLSLSLSLSDGPRSGPRPPPLQRQASAALPVQRLWAAPLAWLRDASSVYS